VTANSWPPASAGGHFSSQWRGAPTGSPVVDEYDAKMPFRFTGTLRKVEIKLGTDQLSPEKQAELARSKNDLEFWVQ
jgi:hypothetical protein